MTAMTQRARCAANAREAQSDRLPSSKQRVGRRIVASWSIQSRCVFCGPSLVGIKASFNARHQGVVGLSRLSHDLMLPLYFKTAEAEELGASFAECRPLILAVWPLRRSFQSWS